MDVETDAIKQVLVAVVVHPGLGNWGNFPCMDGPGTLFISLLHKWLAKPLLIYDIGIISILTAIIYAPII